MTLPDDNLTERSHRGVRPLIRMSTVPHGRKIDDENGTHSLYVHLLIGP